MRKNIKIAIAQINSIVGGLEENSRKILSFAKKAYSRGADIVVFPELSLTGYPPEDLLLKNHFIEENLKSLKNISKDIGDIVAIIGFVDKNKKGLYNSVAVIHNKKIIYTYHKMHLPNYGVFDEKRYFKSGISNRAINVKGMQFGVNICEDIWVEGGGWRVKGAEFMVNISASPYHIGKIEERRKIIGRKAKAARIPVIYCNLIGGQDELVFDGRSTVFGKDGNVLLEAKAFEEDLVVFDLCVKEEKQKINNIDRLEEVYSALKLGVKDYVVKNGFTKVIFGLSGGIDSALVACIAKDALGSSNVFALSMPSRYSSSETQEDAKIIAENLGIKFSNVSIENIFESYLNTLSLYFKGTKPNIAEENIQARIRGNILMAFSNKFGYLVLNTGNKSETSAGYCTLYGDMAGGFSVIKDAPKRLVYELAEYRNKIEGKDLIPKSVFKRPPTAELRPNQKDQDTLPPYDFLDKVIDLYVEKNKGFGEISREIGQQDVVKKILNMIDSSEYKRRQAPPGVKITATAFGKDRRMPITNKFTPD